MNCSSSIKQFSSVAIKYGKCTFQNLLLIGIETYLYWDNRVDMRLIDRGGLSIVDSVRGKVLLTDVSTLSIIVANNFSASIIFRNWSISGQMAWCSTVVADNQIASNNWDCARLLDMC